MSRKIKDRIVNTEFSSIRISLASPEDILSWSHGEVKKPETINYRTLKPEMDGLFCERIFGPVKDYECHCGKYKKHRYKGIVCDKCGVEATKSKVRRERMGHIQLATPCSHIWYFRGVPCRMGIILDIKPKDLETIIYYTNYIVTDPMNTDLSKGQILTEEEFREAQATYGRTAFEAGMGADAIKKLLHDLDLVQLEKDLLEELPEAKSQRRKKIVRQLEVVQSFLQSGNKPEWMVLDVLPVLPPDLRPMVQLDGGRFASSDLNDLYRRVINRNNRLQKMLNMGAPGLIIKNEQRMLQDAVDSLIDNGRRGKPVVGSGNRNLKSLSDLLKGKQGRFRQNLLGKRVDYSGRSVIVIGPDLKMHQCGLPKEMALELFKPFVMHEIVESGLANNIKTAKRVVEKAEPFVWDSLAKVIKGKAVLLNRAPTLHRLGIQAFEPVLVEGHAIKLHPLYCSPYNADFDGDQMAVHLPLSHEAQAEARFLMLGSNNLLKPQDGKPITVPGQDMVLGLYYLTMEEPGVLGEGKAYSSFDEAMLAYQWGHVSLHAKIKIFREVQEEGKDRVRKVVESTLGRFIFNTIIPQDLGFVDRRDEAHKLDLEVDFTVGKKQLRDIIGKAIQTHGLATTSHLLDAIKNMGFAYCTKSGLSIGINDLAVHSNKQAMLDEAQRTVDAINMDYARGVSSDEERYRNVVRVWDETTNKVTEDLKENLGDTNPVKMMSVSGARGNINQIKQLAGMRGNMIDTSGKVLEIPIKSNLREGMNVLEFFISSHGTRKTLSDTALKTADSGYLTRRLVDISQDVIIHEDDCGTEQCMEVTAIFDNNRLLESLSDRITGRYAAKEIRNPQNNQLIIFKNEMITAAHAKAIEACGITSVPIRSNLTCESSTGVCAKCYGMNLATGKPTVVGEAVGIIAAQSIGEPGTQLTMRNFHQGGIAGEDITAGLPRVEELFEARKPKGIAFISSVAGVVHIEDNGRKGSKVTVTNEEGESEEYEIPSTMHLIVKDGQKLNLGQKITEGSVNPHDIMDINGPSGVEEYILAEVLKVYKSNGVDINDKHIEIIIRQMLRKVIIEDPGDSTMGIGTIQDLFNVRALNKEIEAKNGHPISFHRILLGITKASLSTDSFLSAASFQEQTKVLTDAAVKGKVDPLKGLKENVIIGKLIPAGTGLEQYRNITAVPVTSNRTLVDEYGHFDKARDDYYTLNPEYQVNRDREGGDTPAMPV